MTKYTPVSHEAAGALAEEAITDAGGVLEMKTTDARGACFRITFDDYFCYRKLDEGDAFRTLTDVANNSTAANNISELEDSEFLSWFSHESRGVREGQGLKHYRVLTIDSIIDVLALSEPKVRRT